MVNSCGNGVSIWQTTRVIHQLCSTTSWGCISYRSLGSFHVTKVSLGLNSRHFNFVKQALYEINLTRIFLDTKFIQNY